jgi:hypothetical protein
VVLPPIRIVMIVTRVRPIASKAAQPVLPLRRDAFGAMLMLVALVPKPPYPSFRSAKHPTIHELVPRWPISRSQTPYMAP